MIVPPKALLREFVCCGRSNSFISIADAEGDFLTGAVDVMVGIVIPTVTFWSRLLGGAESFKDHLYVGTFRTADELILSCTHRPGAPFSKGS